MTSSQLRRTFSLLRARTGNGQTWTRSLFMDSGSSSSGLVLQSQSTDVYQNLALEDWIDAHVDLQQRSILLLWRNGPAVVIGRHQNPWTECSLSAMRRLGIPLARRRSGGGTVYHDLGNLNMTFFASRKAYDRQRNLKVVTEALRRLRPELDVRATDRFDILLNGRYKISGTASRLSRRSSYHHCTLLHSADRSALSAVLRHSCPGIQSNATPSIPSPVTNLVDHAPSLEWEELLGALVQQYTREFDLRPASTAVDPSNESSFPGVGSLAAELRSWEWTFGKTPKFSIKTELELMDEQLDAHCSAHLHMEVKNGQVGSCRLDVPADWLPLQLSSQLSDVLVGERFCPHRAAAAVTELLRSESGQPHTRLHNLCEAVLAVIG
ncbi:lipoyltransferase 1, mitochondrial [Kryptolebias marmoratus]|uniref:Lipoyltransferase 1 n=1 Tax=Kryptolebias marmoratus TaxID=37003 RepID=A0A3Q2ZPU7_KRYMA|nr:lipoyltransferase 1, mitochondrial [Kryptolebias marmoratus]XP_017290069.1 lipoyltransferase 1, mitochondrial [Kryptolebias marmoratus]